MDESSTIGDRLKRARKERGLSQEQLAEKAGVSHSLITKLESGKRAMARITTLTMLADALGITLSDLLGRHEQLGNDGGILPLRDALLDPADLPGIDPSDDTGEPTPQAELETMVERAWNLSWAGRLAELTARLPGLLGETRLATRGPGTHGSQLLAQAYQLAANVLVHTGNDDLAFAAVMRAGWAAADGGDPLQQAVMNSTASWVLLHQGRYDDAERVARLAAEKIEPRMSDASPEHLTVWGALLLSAAAAAAAASRTGQVRDYITITRAATQVTRNGEPLFPSDRHDYHTNFGRTQVEMQACYTFSVLGEPGDALRAASRVRRNDLLPISWGAHNLDVAQAELQAHRTERAIGALDRAHAVSAEWFRHQGPARMAVQAALHDETRKNPTLRRLADSIGAR